MQAGQGDPPSYSMKKGEEACRSSPSSYSAATTEAGVSLSG